METNEILCSKDLARLLNITTNKLTRLTKQGLPCVDLGGGMRIFLRDAVLNWLKNRGNSQ